MEGACHRFTLDVLGITTFKFKFGAMAGEQQRAARVRASVLG